MKSASVLLIVLALLVTGACFAGCTSTPPAAPISPGVTDTGRVVSSHVHAESDVTNLTSDLAARATLPPQSATPPDLTGIWKGSAAGHSRVNGFVENSVSVYNITAQKGRAFTGLKEYRQANGKTYTDDFSGIVTNHNEIFLGDYISGYTEGRLTGPDSMQLYYIDPGADAKALIIDITRQKN